MGNRSVELAPNEPLVMFFMKLKDLLILEDRTKHPGEGLAYWNV
jgi:hypothetical protein